MTVPRKPRIIRGPWIATGAGPKARPRRERPAQEAATNAAPAANATGRSRTRECAEAFIIACIVFTAINVKTRSDSMDLKLALGAVEDFEEAIPYRIDSELGPIVLVRIGDDFYALQDRCSHQNVPLSEGEVYPGSAEIECYKHGSTFSLRTGEALILPATKPVPTFDVSVEDGRVTLSLG
jgi:3-phenylpropionate/trans-cinnamate dioxygenase ferredoxin subunit